MDKFTIQPNDVSWSGEDRVVIRSIGLLHNFVEEGKVASLKGLKNLIDIPPNSVSIDEHGDIVITNKAVKQAIEAAFPNGPVGLSGPTDTNHSIFCGVINASPACGSNGYCGHVVEEA